MRLFSPDLDKHTVLHSLTKDELLKEAKRQASELAAAHARIAELERCVVMGGDGKPIAAGDIKSGWSYGQIVTGPVRSISHEEGGLVSVCIRCKIETNPISTLYHYFSPAAVYSSPDSVPEGGK